MPQFHFRAVTGAGETIEGEMDAPDRATVIERLHHQGHLPIRADEMRGGSARNVLNQPVFGGAKVARRELTLFTREMATLLRAGLPLDRSMEILIDLTENAAVRRLITKLLEDVRGGASFADAMAIQPKIFPQYYVSMVRAGEAGGSVDDVMLRLADFMEASQKLRENVRSALIYPTIVVVMAGLSMAVLLTVVLPQFTPMFEDAGEALPVLTQVVVAVGEAVERYWWMAILGVLLLVIVVRRQLRYPGARLVWDRWMLNVPLFGGLWAKIEAARFSRTLATLVSNGVALLTALQIVQDTMGNAVLRKAVGEISGGLKEGEGLAEPLTKVRHFPRLGAHLIGVGEETGRLEDMLFKAADIYDDEVQRTISRLLALLLPILTIGLGVLIALVIGSILAAMLSVYDLPF